MLHFDNVTKSYPVGSQTLPVLDQTSFHVPAHSATVVVGPSGCGKTTLLRLACLLETPTTGTVAFGGISPTSPPTLSVVFQRPVVLPWRTVLDNVLLPTQVGTPSTTRNAALQRARGLLAQLGLAEFELYYPRQLSGGMIQRMLLARALMTSPDLLCLDEPFSGLDEQTRQRMWLLLRDTMRASSVAILLVTHSVAEATFVGDKIVVLSPRPARVQADLHVDLPAERALLLLDDPEFHRHVAMVHRALGYE